ncbi:LAG1 longevity assurance homolog [Seminavis robusta]|uniref:LAG1 longevity assurance homolog n=1 Tax=Seminavis robusta TaxID=568900 RepID=A0A9N8EZI8_9STRA|nr:LAG1 longevity assurance homolog [Seminavis robusta]|eukprot:Sro2229_g319960.1 LAG1 longevity assurance homolog (352) ;mRNA; r:11704-12940
MLDNAMLDNGWQYTQSLWEVFHNTVFLGQTLKSTEIVPQPAQCFKIHVPNGGELATATEFFLASSHDHPCAGLDWIVLLYLFLVVHCCSWFSRWLVWEPFARWRLGVSSNCGDATTKRKIENFSQSVNAASFHILSSIFVWRILSQKEWLWSTEAWGDPTALSSIEPDFKFYYLLYAARYISDMLSLYYENKRSDTLAYAIHHVATVALVLLSGHVGLTRVGGVIMFFFDWTDPFMLIAKALVYLSRKPTDIYQWLADRLFELFAVSFFLTRNLMFSCVVYVVFQYDFNDYPEIPATAAFILKSMLIVLELLMTFWLVLIIKAAINQLSNEGNVEDIREDEFTTTKKKKGI